MTYDWRYSAGSHQNSWDPRGKPTRCPRIPWSSAEPIVSHGIQWHPVGSNDKSRGNAAKHMIATPPSETFVGIGCRQACFGIREERLAFTRENPRTHARSRTHERQGYTLLPLSCSPLYLPPRFAPFRHDFVVRTNMFYAAYSAVAHPEGDGTCGGWRS